MTKEELQEIRSVVREETSQEISQQMNLMVENFFMPKFSLLAENQQLIMEKLQGLDDLEVMDTRITALEAMVKKINRELKELKQAQ